MTGIVVMVIVVILVLLVRAELREVNRREDKCLHGMKLHLYCVACDGRRPRWYR